MKIRLDYVSNSSSSSFMLVGSAYEREELMDAIKKSGVDLLEDLSPEERKNLEENDDELLDYEYDAFLCKLDKWLEKFGLDYHFGISDYDEDTVCVGMSYDQMRSDETKAAFELRIWEALEKLMGAPQKVTCMIDGGMDC